MCVDRRTSSVKDENIGLFFLFLVVTMNGERFTPVNTFEYEALAKLKLPKMVYDYYASGADDEYTLEDNIAAFRRIRLRPRVLVDISAQDISTTLLGIPSSFPLVIAPAAMQKMAHPNGEVAVARAAAKNKVIMTLSSLSTCSMEQVAESSPAGAKWFQLYIYKDRQVTKKLVERAQNAGYRALVLTVDAQRLGRREADIHNEFSLPQHLTFGNFQEERTTNDDKTRTKSAQGSGIEAYFASLMDPSLTWKDIAWLQSITRLPIILKGITTAEDAQKAVQSGVAAVIVSNHGARQLDGMLATIDCVEEVVDAVRSRIPVLMDSGVRRGTDILKALALGAKAVCIGRPVLWALAVGGEEGVDDVLNLLRNEFHLAMGLVGCRSVEEIDRRIVVHQDVARIQKLKPKTYPQPLSQNARL